VAWDHHDGPEQFDASAHRKPQLKSGLGERFLSGPSAWLLPLFTPLHLCHLRPMGQTLDPFRYLTYIRDCLRRRGRTREQAEDLVQEAFLRMELYCREGRKVLEPAAFVMRTALNLSVSDKRHEARTVVARKALSDVLPAELPPDEVFAAEERLEHIRRLLDAVSRRTRDVFFLHRLGGFSYAEIAQRMGVSVSAIEKHIASATAVLALERQNDQP
jgi:RNA polymerase sigma factor (sigma-70 family)